MVVVNADLVWAHNNLFAKDDTATKKDTDRAVKVEGGNAREAKDLLNPRLARRLLDKPHS